MTRQVAGVERVAHQALGAIVALQAELGDASPDLHWAFPKVFASNAVANLDNTAYGGQHEVGRLNGHLWEQLELPFVRPKEWLLNFCNSGPIARRRQLVIIHDAQVYQQRQSYSWAFWSWYRVLLPALGNRSRLVMTVSNHSRRELERYGVVPFGKVHVAHLGADHIDQIQAEPGALDMFGLGSHKYMIAVGSLAEHKNLAMLARAAANRVAHDVPLVVVGDCDQSVFTSAADLQGSSVRLLGRVSDAQLKALFEGALAFVLPSKTEGFGLSALEAMRCGCPVIATTGGAVPEVCGDAALLVDPNDEQAWTSALERVQQDSGIRDQLREAGFVRSSQFTWRRFAIRVLSLLASQQGDQRLLDALSALASDNAQSTTEELAS